MIFEGKIGNVTVIYDDTVICYEEPEYRPVLHQTDATQIGTIVMFTVWYKVSHVDRKHPDTGLETCYMTQREKIEFKQTASIIDLGPKNEAKNPWREVFSTLMNLFSLTRKTLGFEEYALTIEAVGGRLSYSQLQSVFFLRKVREEIPVVETLEDSRKPTTLLSFFQHYWARFLIALGPDHAKALLQRLMMKNILADSNIVALPTSPTPGDDIPSASIILGAFILPLASTKSMSEVAIKGFLVNRLSALSVALPVSVVLDESRSYVNDFTMIDEVRIRYPAFFQEIYLYLCTQNLGAGIAEALGSQWLMCFEWAELMTFNLTYEFAISPITKAHLNKVIIGECIAIEKAMRTLEAEALEKKIHPKYYALCFGHPNYTEMKHYPHAAYAALAQQKDKSQQSWQNYLSAPRLKSVSAAVIDTLITKMWS